MPLKLNTYPFVTTSRYKGLTTLTYTHTDICKTIPKFCFKTHLRVFYGPTLYGILSYIYSCLEQ